MFIDVLIEELKYATEEQDKYIDYMGEDDFMSLFAAPTDDWNAGYVVGYLQAITRVLREYRRNEHE